MHLTEEQHVFIKQYLDLLNTVEEGIVFITDQIDKKQHDHVDNMLNDIFLAFSQFNQSNQMIRDVFVDNINIINTIEEFDQLIDSLTTFDQLMNQPEEKSTFLLDKFIPSFNNWKRNVEYYLANEISH